VLNGCKEPRFFPSMDQCQNTKTYCDAKCDHETQARSPGVSEVMGPTARAHINSLRELASYGKGPSLANKETGRFIGAIALGEPFGCTLSNRSGFMPNRHDSTVAAPTLASKSIGAK